jgi:hypothetical protein
LGPCAASVTFFGLENLGSNSTAGTCDVLVWGGQLNYGNLAPYFPTTDRLNVPRLTYQNGGGGCPSLLLEKQSTNLVTYSEQFDNAAWVLDGDGAGQSVTANYSTSPDGTQNAERLQLNRTGGTYSRLRQAYTAGFSGSATMSVYLKTNDNTTKNVILRLGAAGSTVITVTPNWQRFTNAQSIIYSLGYDFEVFIDQAAQPQNVLFAQTIPPNKLKIYSRSPADDLFGISR